MSIATPHARNLVRKNSGLEFRLKAVAQALRIRHSLRLDPNHPKPVVFEKRFLERILLQEDPLEPVPFRPALRNLAREPLNPRARDIERLDFADIACPPVRWLLDVS